MVVQVKGNTGIRAGFNVGDEIGGLGEYRVLPAVV